MGILNEYSDFKELAPYMVYCGSKNFPEAYYNYTFENKAEECGWNLQAILNGLSFLKEMRERKKAVLYPIYSEEESARTEKENVNIVRLIPKNMDVEKPYIVLCAGGSYTSVGSMIESYPTANQMVERGYQVFVLTYRVAEKPVLPNALYDLAAAIRYIDAHAEEFCIKAGNYCVGGFSAGASVAANFGTRVAGYEQFGLSAPKIIFLIYVRVNVEEFRKSAMLTQMFGDNFIWEEAEKYMVEKHLDCFYPPCYLVCGKDDRIVPYTNSVILHEKLDDLGVNNYLEIGEHAPHGFGDGTGTDVEGWSQRAINFLEKLC